MFPPLPSWAVRPLPLLGKSSRHAPRCRVIMSLSLDGEARSRSQVLWYFSPAPASLTRITKRVPHGFQRRCAPALQTFEASREAEAGRSPHISCHPGLHRMSRPALATVWDAVEKYKTEQKKSIRGGKKLWSLCRDHQDGTAGNGA